MVAHSALVAAALAGTSFAYLKNPSQSTEDVGLVAAAAAAPAPPLGSLPPGKYEGEVVDLKTGVIALDEDVKLVEVAAKVMPISISVVNTDSQPVKIPCKQCVLAKPAPGTHKDANGNEVTNWIDGGDTSIFLNIHTLLDGTAVGLNGYPLYPPLEASEKPSIDVVQSAASLADIQGNKAAKVTVPVSSDLSVISEETVAPSGDAVIRIKYRILALKEHLVSVDAIEITILKDADNKLSILSVSPAPTTGGSSDDSRPPMMGHGRPRLPCQMPAMLCALRDAIQDKVHEIQTHMPHAIGAHVPLPFGRKPCHRKPGSPFRAADGAMHLPTHIRPQFHHGDAQSEQPTGHHGKPPHVVGGEHIKSIQHEGEHMPEHHRPRPHFHHDSRFLHVIKGLMFVLVPIVLGITMGFFVSLVGIVVGKLIVCLWVLFRRRQQQRSSYNHVLASDEADGLTSEGQYGKQDDDMESVCSEDLPGYSEETPLYTEKRDS